MTFDGLLTILPNLVDNQHHTFSNFFGSINSCHSVFCFESVDACEWLNQSSAKFSVFCLLSAFFSQLFMSASDVPGFFFFAVTLACLFNLLLLLVTSGRKISLIVFNSR